MNNEIYIKTSQCVESKTPEQLRDYLSQSNLLSSVIGVYPEGAHYLFVRDANSFRRYPIALHNKAYFVVRYFVSFNETKKAFETTPQPIEGASPQIPSEGFFSSEEIEKIKDDLKRGVREQQEHEIPIFEDMSLSQAQQKMLFSGCISLATTQSSFRDILEGELNGLSAEGKTIALQAMILKNELRDKLQCTDEINNAVSTILFEFFSPNRINQFSDVLRKNQAYHPTIGDIANYYTRCIQKELGKLGKDPVNAEALRQLSPEASSVRLGMKEETSIRRLFNPEEIFSPQGLSGNNAVIYETLMSLFGLQQHMENDETLLNIIQATPERQAIKVELLSVFSKLIDAIKNNAPTDIAYLELFNNINAIYPREQWNYFLPRFEKLERAYILSEAIYLLNKLSDEKLIDDHRTQILNAVKDRLARLIRLIQDGYGLNILLSHNKLTDVHLAQILNAARDNLVHLIQDVKQLSNLLSHNKLTDDYRGEILDAVKDHLVSLIQDGYNLNFLLSNNELTDAHRTQIWDAVKDHLMSLIQNGHQLYRLLSNNKLTPGHRIQIWDAVEDRLVSLIQDTRQLIPLLSHDKLTPEQKIRIMQVVPNEISESMLSDKQLFQSLKNIVEHKSSKLVEQEKVFSSTSCGLFGKQFEVNVTNFQLYLTLRLMAMQYEKTGEDSSIQKLKTLIQDVASVTSAHEAFQKIQSVSFSRSRLSDAFGLLSTQLETTGTIAIDFILEKLITEKYSLNERVAKHNPRALARGQASL